MTLEVKVEQDPVVFHVVIFENSIWRRVTNSVDKLKTLVWENTNSSFKSTDSSSNIRRIIFGVRKKKANKKSTGIISNIWKSYLWTVGEELNMEAIFVVMNIT